MLMREEKEELILRNTKEFFTKEELKEALDRRNLRAYLGRAITGPLHIGHLVSLSKLKDLQKADIHVIILLADIHAALDDLKAKWEDLDIRLEYTKKAIELAVGWEKMPEFVRGRDFQLTREYEMDIFKLATITKVKEGLHAASEVTRMSDPKVSEVIYPIMQALDEEYLNVDIQVGGLDQRHIMMYAREYLPKIGYRRRMELMMPLLPSLKGPGVKMSSSISGTKIPVTASEETIRKLINSAYCPEKSLEGNPIVSLIDLYVLPNEGTIKIDREEKFGGTIEIKSPEEMDRLYTEGSVHPKDVKEYVSSYLIRKLKPVREYFESNSDMLDKLGPEFR